MSDNKTKLGEHHLERELGTISEPTKKWRCKDCGGTENHDHRGCMKEHEIEEMARKHEAFYAVAADYLSRSTFLTILKKANEKLSA